MISWRQKGDSREVKRYMSYNTEVHELYYRGRCVISKRYWSDITEVTVEK